MSFTAVLLLVLLGFVTGEFGQKGYTPKYNYKTYGYIYGPGYGGSIGNVGGYGLFGQYGLLGEGYSGIYGNSEHGL